MKSKLVALAALGATAAIVVSALPAAADPSGAPTYRPLAGGGSDTTFEVMNGLSDVVVVGGSKVIGSYNPTPAGELVSTKDESLFNGRCNTAGGSGGAPRPNGSSAGRDALLAAMTPGNALEGCWDFARTSSGSVAAGQTFVPMAQDGLTYAFPSNGDIGSRSTLADLQLIYKCDPALAGVFQPFIPQAGSGTRSSWATLMGISNSTLPSCVKDVFNGQPVQEHTGSPLQASNSLVPFSVAQYISQQFGQTTDLRGKAQLGQINGVNPVVLNPNQASVRVVGNILPTTVFNDAASLANDVFVDNGTGKSEVCVDGKNVIENFGFRAHTC